MFDNVVFTVAQLTRTPFAVVGLVGRSRVWPKARVGPTSLECERAAAFCRAVVDCGTVLAVPDALLDPRFELPPGSNAGPMLRFFAGAPVYGPGGYRIGCLCVADTQVRNATVRHLNSLRQMAEQASELIQFRVPLAN